MTDFKFDVFSLVNWEKYKDGNFHNVVVTYDGKIRVYVDGVTV